MLQPDWCTLGSLEMLSHHAVFTYALPSAPNPSLPSQLSHGELFFILQYPFYHTLKAYHYPSPSNWLLLKHNSNQFTSLIKQFSGFWSTAENPRSLVDLCKHWFLTALSLLLPFLVPRMLLHSFRECCVWILVLILLSGWYWANF